MGRALVVLVSIFSLVFAACGGDNGEVSGGTDAQPQTEGTSFASGEFTGLPLPTGAEAFMPVNHKDGVATQSYEVPGLTAEGVLRYYEEYLAADEWTNTEPPHASGTVGWMGAWIDVDGRLLEVSAVPLALDEPDSTVTQFSLVLHEDAAAGG